jgi:hypothetical protein
MKLKTPRDLGTCSWGHVLPLSKQNRAAPASAANEVSQLTADTGVLSGAQLGALMQLVTQVLHYCELALVAAFRCHAAPHNNPAVALTIPRGNELQGISTAILDLGLARLATQEAIARERRHIECMRS